MKTSFAYVATLALVSAALAQQESGKNCFDKRDNDGDGKTDCQDPGCYNGEYAKYCQPGGVYCKPYCKGSDGSSSGGKETGKACFDGRDNDGDGQTDCQDPGCYNGIYGKYCKGKGSSGKGGGKGGGKGKGKGNCGSSTHERRRCCFDGVDVSTCVAISSSPFRHLAIASLCVTYIRVRPPLQNDSDGKSDCQDPDCLRDRRVGQKCRWEARKQQGSGSKHEGGKACFDGKDNDGDGKKDCEDPDCQKDPRVGRYCRKKTSKGNSNPTSVPEGCVRWYDGCNSCTRQNMNAPLRCSKRMCFRQGKPACRAYDRAYHKGGH